jgi:hypothetical protein
MSASTWFAFAAALVTGWLGDLSPVKSQLQDATDQGTGT